MYSYYRLKRGLPETYSTRKAVFFREISYGMWYVIYWLIAQTLYAISFWQGKDAPTFIMRALGVVVAIRGTFTGLAWYFSNNSVERQIRKAIEKEKKDKKGQEESESVSGIVVEDNEEEVNDIYDLRC